MGDKGDKHVGLKSYQPVRHLAHPLLRLIGVFDQGDIDPSGLPGLLDIRDTVPVADDYDIIPLHVPPLLTYVRERVNKKNVDRNVKILYYPVL